MLCILILALLISIPTALYDSISVNERYSIGHRASNAADMYLLSQTNAPPEPISSHSQQPAQDQEPAQSQQPANNQQVAKRPGRPKGSRNKVKCAVEPIHESAQSQDAESAPVTKRKPGRPRKLVGALKEKLFF